MKKVLYIFAIALSAISCGVQRFTDGIYAPVSATKTQAPEKTLNGCIKSECDLIIADVGMNYSAEQRDEFIYVGRLKYPGHISFAGLRSGKPYRDRIIKYMESKLEKVWSSETFTAYTNGEFFYLVPTTEYLIYKGDYATQYHFCDVFTVFEEMEGYAEKESKPYFWEKAQKEKARIARMEAKAEAKRVSF